MRRYQTSRTPRIITVKYDGKCHCCGAIIKAGQTATYYPDKRVLSHVGGLDGNSATCTANIRAQQAINDYAGDGLDARYEDQCAEICGR